MKQKTLDILACPNCLSDLVASEGATEIEDGMLTCRREDLRFPISSGIPLLVRPNSEERVRAFEASFAKAWSRDGWGAADDAYLFSLPQRDITRRHSSEWRVKSRSMEALFRILDPARNPRVVDLGCGLGWLAHHLARRGHDVYAVDIVRDPLVGLGAAARYARRGPFFERIWGELERPPFRNSCIDGVICNASLHYALDLDGAIEGIARIIKPRGLFVIMNSPVYFDQRSASRAQEEFRERLCRCGAALDVTSVYRHFTRGELEATVGSHIGPVAEMPFSPGNWFLLVRRAKEFALRMELASFPLLYARKT